MKKNKWLFKIIFLNLFTLCLLLMCLEFFLRKNNGKAPLFRKEISREFFFFDELYGYKMSKNKVVSFKKYKDNEKIIDVTCQINADGHRVTPVEAKNIRKKFVLFVGGSNTFGEALSSHETLPYYFGQIATNYMPYNYGVPGYGPQQVLILFQHEKLNQTIKQESGLAVYRYYSFHRKRLMGTLKFLEYAEGKHPYYYIKDGRLVRDGSFNTGRPFLTQILKALGRLKFVNSFKWDYPRVFSKQTNELMCKIIQESKVEFLKKFPKSKFVVQIGIDTRNEDPLIEGCLKKNKISFIDMREHWDGSTMGSHQIPFDGHQNKKSNELAAKKLYEKFVKE